jgi:ribosomal-protein-alanine N-acetyltransferase
MTEIRRGRPADLPRLRQVQSDALAEPWPELLETAARGTPALYVVADGRPVGYVVVVDGGSVAYIPELAVDPERQGRGHGSELLSALCQRLTDEGCQQIRLTVRASDDGARRFYDRHGFERLDRLAGHFADCDGLLLGLSLGEDT